MGRKLRIRLPTFQSLLEPKTRPLTQVYQKLLLRKESILLREGDTVRMQQGREWTPAVVVKQHQASRLFIVVTPDGTQIRRNRVHLQPTKEESPPAMGPAWELTNYEHSPPMLSSADTAVEMNGAKSQPDTSQAYKPVRRSQMVPRPLQRLIETV